MSRTPNHEQKIAIEAENGVLLSAGAGSGKTFVIVEHLLFKIEKNVKNYKKESWNIEIPKFLRSIVLMTFTKKAAGEMSVRLLKRLEEKNENDQNGYWKIVISNINSLHISTIHGFCHKLISSGIWTNYPNNFELLNETNHEIKLRKLFNAWYNESQSKLEPVFLAHTEEIFFAISEIFKNPDLRLMWKTANNKIGKEEELKLFFNSIKDLSDVFDAFDFNLCCDYGPEQMKKGIYKLFHDFNELKKMNGEIDDKNMELYFQFVESVSRFPSPVKDLSQEDIEYREKIKIFFEFIKTIKTDLRAFCDYNDVYQKWIDVFQGIFNYIDANYFKFPGFAFSDLEYYVSIGLNDNLVAAQVAMKYHYFIIDEFQDTSPIQYDILKKCIQNDFSRLFCVGDKKQAIYGFRGGELQVFENCSIEMSKERNLSLLSNYRSDKKIINFNNDFFKTLLVSGEGFEGKDRHIVNMEEQIAPFVEEKGSVRKYSVEVIDAKLDPDMLEAHAILEIIRESLKDTSINSIAILYRKLKPSLYLVELLQKNKIGFIAQTKINHNDDPVVQVFEYLVRYLLTQDVGKKSSLHYAVTKILEALSTSLEQDNIIQFEKNYKLYGVYVSFLKLLKDLKISDAYFTNNLELIENLVNSSGSDLRILAESLENISGSYSIDLITGENKKVHILSTHTSKGLEYDSVVVAGIHKNGRSDGLKSKLGKMPRSFKWKANFNQKKYFSSPNFYIENFILKEKEFSESKRLLYVACTRAVKNLSFVVFKAEKSLSKYSNSWINAFEKHSRGLTEEISISESFSINQNVDLSLLLKDNVGLEKYNSNSSLAVVSELSVTRLVSLIECPFKFYLKNICKIEVDINPVLSIFDQDDEVVVKSSAERGSNLHIQISNAILGRSGDLSPEASWAIEEFKKSAPQNFYSEKEIKFSFFGIMISAIPDLYFVNNDQIEIWDFKSGARDEQKEVGYWFQLFAYAYGISMIDKINQDCIFNLKILYLDQKNIVSKSLKLIEIKEFLYSKWKNLENLSQVNINHCQKCEYNQMCKSASIVATI